MLDAALSFGFQGRLPVAGACWPVLCIPCIQQRFCEGLRNIGANASGASFHGAHQTRVRNWNLGGNRLSWKKGGPKPPGLPVTDFSSDGSKVVNVTFKVSDAVSEAVGVSVQVCELGLKVCNSSQQFFRRARFHPGARAALSFVVLICRVHAFFFLPPFPEPVCPSLSLSSLFFRRGALFSVTVNFHANCSTDKAIACPLIV